MTAPTPPVFSAEMAECRAEIELICEREGIRIAHIPWVVEMLAADWALWRRAAAELFADGLTVETVMAEGLIDRKTHPALGAYNSLELRIFKAGADLGLVSKALRDEPDEADEGEPEQPAVVRYKFDGGA